MDIVTRYETFIGKIASGQIIYFEHPYENAVIRYNGDGTYTVKLKGFQPFNTTKKNDLVNEAILKCSEITKEQYSNF